MLTILHILIVIGPTNNYKIGYRTVAANYLLVFSENTNFSSEGDSFGGGGGNTTSVLIKSYLSMRRGCSDSPLSRIRIVSVMAEFAVVEGSYNYACA